MPVPNDYPPRVRERGERRTMRSGTDIGQVTEPPTPPPHALRKAEEEWRAGGRRRQNWLPLRPPLPSFLPLFPLLDTEGGLLIRRMIINTRERGMDGGRER